MTTRTRTPSKAANDYGEGPRTAFAVRLPPPLIGRIKHVVMIYTLMHPGVRASEGSITESILDGRRSLASFETEIDAWKKSAAGRVALANGGRT